jgi:hypothetical protein
LAQNSAVTLEQVIAAVVAAKPSVGASLEVMMVEQPVIARSAMVFRKPCNTWQLVCCQSRSLSIGTLGLSSATNTRRFVSMVADQNQDDEK